ncbi:hypothetical protein PR048_000209 [Dryococelus australis]|uniref:Uncharacterized protein n=1 Tax=Dryococelus australis TaxID=614101 RepID=A0ABQ9IE15_9NEOP|nr:hypothetical protein PR048_000209 [Dryococelus australis]
MGCTNDIVNSSRWRPGNICTHKRRDPAAAQHPGTFGVREQLGTSQVQSLNMPRARVASEAIYPTRGCTSSIPGRDHVRGNAADGDVIWWFSSGCSRFAPSFHSADLFRFRLANTPATIRYPITFKTIQRYGGNTARLARRSDEALGVRVSVARMTLSLLDLGQDVPTGLAPRSRARASLIAELKHTELTCNAYQGLERALSDCTFGGMGKSLARGNRRPPATTRTDTRELPRCATTMAGNSPEKRQPDEKFPEFLDVNRSSNGSVTGSNSSRTRLAKYDPTETEYLSLTRNICWAAVAERLARSPPTKANRVRFPAGSPGFRKWESCRTIPLAAGFSRGSPVSPALAFQRRSILTLLHPHRILRLVHGPASRLFVSAATEPRPKLNQPTPRFYMQATCERRARDAMKHRSDGMQGRGGNGRNPRKTRQTTATSVAFITCEILEEPSGIE